MGTDSVKLPSEFVYKAFDADGDPYTFHRDECDRSDLVRKVEASLRSYPTIKDLASKFVRNYCYACEMVDNSSAYTERCHFLYYWIGEKLKGKLYHVDLQFPGAMSTIYWDSVKSACKCECENLYLRISKDLFEKTKLLFDYNYDYRTMQEEAGSYDHATCKNLEGKYNGALDAYNSISNICSEDRRNPYCMKFNKELKEEQYQKPPELTCPIVKPATAAKPITEERGDDSEEMPSKKIYTRLDQYQTVSCTTSGFGDKIKTTLTTAGVGTNIAQQIIKTLCYISKKENYEGEDEDSEQDEDNTLFYYWMGEKISHSLSNEKFKEVMNNCKQKIESKREEYECTFIDTPDKKEVFEAWKRVYDYSLDKDFMEKKVKSGQGSCTDEYCGYLTKAQCAYQTMKIKCAGEGSSEWCEKFNKLYRECERAEYTGSECRVAKTPAESCAGDSKAEDSTYITTDTSTTGKSAVAAISSAAAALVGLPLITFALYKYNLLPSWFGNDFGNQFGKRRKRRTTVEIDFDTLTDNSTVYITDISGDDNSTIIGSIEDGTDNSSIYNERSTRRPPPPGQRGGRTNNGRKQQNRNIGYQNM